MDGVFEPILLVFIRFGSTGMRLGRLTAVFLEGFFWIRGFLWGGEEEEEGEGEGDETVFLFVVMRKGKREN